MASGTSVSLTVDETTLATNATASFAGAFTPNFGADGPLDADHNGVADAGAVTYALGFNAGSTGLVDTATGQAVVLSLEGGQVVGRAGAGGAIVFTVSTDASGNVTLDQQRAVVHSDPNNPNDNATLSAANLVTLTATVTDGDGDHASQTINIGTSLNFHDDAPSIVASGTSVSLTVDETTLATNATASFAGAFTPNFGADGPLDADHNGVADAGAVTYALGFNAGSTGLVDTATGQAVVLSLEGGQVVGRAGAGGAIVFTVSTDASGNVTLDQQRAVVHSDPNNPNDNATLSAANLVTLTATVTDGDGDHASQTINIGTSLNFHDDGPTLGSFTSGTIPNEVGAVSGLFSISAGADGLDHFNITGPVIAGITYTASHTADGTTVLHAMSGATEVFDLTVRPDGTYEFDLITPQAVTSVTQTLTGLSAGGPTPFLETPDGLVEFTGSGSGVNSSTQGFGVSDQFVESGENFTMEFHTSGTPGNDAPTLNPRYVSALDFTASSNSSGSVHWTATNTGTGQTENGTATLTNGHLIIDPSIDFNVISITGDPSSKLRLESVGISQTILPSDSNYHFQVSAVDKDGDVSAIQGLDIHQVAAGSGGNYTLNGFAGAVNDVIAGSTHVDTIAGGAGTDIADYTGSTSAVSIHLADDGHASGAPVTFGNPEIGTIGGGDATGDSLTGIEGLIGGVGNDFLFGNAGDNYLAGGAGNDTINGGGGNDILVGGLGQDTLTGGAGADTFKLDHIDIKDLITDYNGAQGDVIDLTSLFKTGSENIGDYVNYDQATGTLSVDVDGAAGGASFVPVAQLTNPVLPAANTITLLYDDGAHTHTTTANVV
ncbi:DUF5801 repeats-in-toxin domain-containing protein [Mesorhizobium sp. M2E.F.Ca.ET.209.01.1.1]|uniref:DUF5801 repeats-in-toxin domain-containing protein n=2 Tax=unclassified Mesorhizobium TaxID=325217 RepID=UPI002484A56C|nr:DUF5801 repeats-in-toxin domain-containing protein [Mesorhizobium sp. M2E.F.Ca.ET.209.01.1.1]